MKNRVFLEEFARDSYENLLFSICRFKEATGNYPSRVTVIGFDFKENRFSKLHRKAIGFPKDSFTYIGIFFSQNDTKHNVYFISKCICFSVSLYFLISFLFLLFFCSFFLRFYFIALTPVII